MSSDSKKEIGVGVFFFVFAIAYMVGASKISTFTPFGNRGLDSRSVPELLGILTIILSITYMVQVWFKERKLKKILEESGANSAQVGDQKETTATPESKGTIISRINNVMPTKLILSLIFLAVYTALYQPLGFILSSIFFLIAESFLLVNKDERKKWILFIVLFSVGISIFIYFIFTKYLTLVLPSGILG